MVWVVENVEGDNLPNNELNQPYAIRSSHVIGQYVKFFDDWKQGEREADAMNELEVKEPGQ